MPALPHDPSIPDYSSTETAEKGILCSPCRPPRRRQGILYYRNYRHLSKARGARKLGSRECGKKICASREYEIPNALPFSVNSPTCTCMAGTTQGLVSDFCQLLNAAALQMCDPRILVSVSYMIGPKLIITEEY